MNGTGSWWSSHFTPMLPAWQWLLLALVPPAVILLYFLKLRRQPLEVPSTFLWRKSIEDLHVNSIWQKLRQNLLLFLQLLILLLAILALLRPGYQGTKLVGNRFIFLIDNSASMSATDVAESRLADACEQVAKLIDQMGSGDLAMIISFSDSARVVQPFTDNRRELRRRLESIKPTFNSTTLIEALRVAAGLANPGSDASGEGTGGEELPATLYLLSDGKFPDVQGFALGSLKPIYLPVGQPKASNVGLTAFAVERGEGRSDRHEAFARIENFGTEDLTVNISLLHDGTVIDADEVKAPAGQSTGVAFQLPAIETGVLEARISPGGDLKSDDRAWAVLSPPRRGQVLLVSPGNDALQFALGTPRSSELAEVTVTEPAFLKTPEYKQQAASGAYDLVIYDQCQPEEMPQANTLFIGRLPPLAGWGYDAKKPAEEVVGPQIIDVAAAHPLMQLIDLGNVSFVKAVRMQVPAGGTRLVESNEGVLCAVATRDTFEDAVLAAEIVGEDAEGNRYANTDWPLRLSFPVFVLNVLEYLGQTGMIADAGSIRPGQMAVIRSTTGAEKITIRTPGGTTHELLRNQNGAFNFSASHQLGVYQVEEKGKPTQAFAVNLFDAAESDIRPRPENSIKIGYSEVRADTGSEVARQELWRPLLLAAFIVLLGEWYIYNRRVYI